MSRMKNLPNKEIALRLDISVKTVEFHITRALKQLRAVSYTHLDVYKRQAPDCAKAGDAAAALKPGEVLLLENLRFYPEEEGKPVGIDKERCV